MFVVPISAICFVTSPRLNVHNDNIDTANRAGRVSAAVITLTFITSPSRFTKLLPTWRHATHLPQARLSTAWGTHTHPLSPSLPLFLHLSLSLSSSCAPSLSLPPSPAQGHVHCVVLDCERCSGLSKLSAFESPAVNQPPASHVTWSLLRTS